MSVSPAAPPPCRSRSLFPRLRLPAIDRLPVTSSVRLDCVALLRSAIVPAVIEMAGRFNAVIPPADGENATVPGPDLLNVPAAVMFNGSARLGLPAPGSAAAGHFN